MKFWGAEGIPQVNASTVWPALLEAGSWQLLHGLWLDWAWSDRGGAVRLWADPISAPGLSFPIYKMRRLNWRFSKALSSSDALDSSALLPAGEWQLGKEAHVSGTPAPLCSPRASAGSPGCLSTPAPSTQWMWVQPYDVAGCVLAAGARGPLVQSCRKQIRITYLLTHWSPRWALGCRGERDRQR